MSFSSESYALTRLVFQRSLALVFLVAFLNAANQFKPLLGERGLLPVPQFVKEVPFRESPSLFFFSPSDKTFTTCAWLGVFLASLAIAGIPEQFSIWFSMLV